MTTRSWAERWNRIKTKLTLTDLLLDMSGKMLLTLGLGACLASYLAPYAWGLIIVGFGLSVAVKLKYWKQFWG